MRNRSHQTVLLTVLMAAGIGVGLFACAYVRSTEREANSDEITLDLGDQRAQMTKLIAERRGLSQREAQVCLRQLEERKRLRVLNQVSLPNNTLADFVRVGGRQPVENLGSGVLMNPNSAEGKRFLEQVEAQGGPAARRYFMQKWDEAAKKGLLNWTLTEEQRDRLLALSEGRSVTTRSRQGPVALRCLVVATEFPEWVDRAPQYPPTGARDVYYNTRVIGGRSTYFHPLSDQDNSGIPDRFEGVDPLGETPAGPLVPTFDHANFNSDYTLAGLGYGNETHPGVRGQTYPQSVGMRERWYTLLFDPLNANSVLNYYWQNSHGHVRLSGDRSDIVGWLESRHQLDRSDIAPNTDPWYAFQPGTPLIRPIAEPTGDPVMAYATVNTTADIPSNGNMVDSWITVVWSRDARTIPGATNRALYNIQSPAGSPLVIGSSRINLRVDPFDPRRVVLLLAQGGQTIGPYWGNTWRITFNNGTLNQTRFGITDAGVSLSGVGGGTLFVDGEVMGSTGPSDTANPQAPLTPHRLKSYCYYTTDHEFRSGDPYQLLHLRNRQNRIDDIGGNVDSAQDRRGRPAPYDHDLEDHSRPNGGVLGPYPHNVFGLREDINFLLADNGVDLSVYDRIIYVYPDGGSPPLTGNAVGNTIMVPESADLMGVAFNLGGTFGLPGLWDRDAGAAYNPPHRVTHAMGPYSIMAGGGMRLDPLSKLIAIPGPWITPIDVAADRLGQRIPQVEGISEEARVLRIPVPGPTGEFFLVENHNQQLFGDSTPRGLSIFHVDPRYNVYYAPDLLPQSGGQNDDLWYMIPEQADGQFELERKLSSQPLTTLATDSFGADAPSGVTVWNQYGSDVAGNPLATSKSRGLADTDGNLLPGTAFDSYIRLANISNLGAVMTADIYVQPRELIVTGQSLAPATVQQGAKNVPILQLDFGHSAQSTNDVTVDTLRMNESGSSKVDTDVARVSLIDESNGVAGFQATAQGAVDADRLVASSTFSSQEVTFTNLAYLVKLGQTRTMYVVFDIAETVDTSADVTVGVQIAQADHIRPKVPGAIQERFGTNQFRFPIPQGTLASTRILEAEDTLSVTPVSRAPSTVNQGAQDIPMLSLNLAVNRDSVLIERLRVREDGTSDQDADVLTVNLYDDPEQDGAVGLNDVLVASVPLSGQVADFQGLSYAVVDGTSRSLLLTYTLSDFAAIGKTLSAALPDTGFVSLADPADTVSVANFPVTSGPAVIERATHNLRVAASSLALPFVDPGQTNVPFEKLVLTPDAGVVTLKGLTVRQAGTGVVGASDDIKAIHVYRDTNQTGLLETTGTSPDTLLVTSTTFVDTDTPADGVPDGVVFLTDANTFPAGFTINAGASETLFLAADVGDPMLAKVGKTIDLAVVNAAAIDATPDTTLLSTGTFPVQSGPSMIRGLVTVAVGDSVPDGAAVAQGALGQFMFRLDAASTSSDVTLDTLVVGRGGTGTDSDVLQVTVYQDADGDQVLGTTTDTLLGAAPFTSGQVIFSGLTINIGANQVVSLFIVYDVAGNATAGATLSAQLLSSGALSGSGVQIDPTVSFPLASGALVIADAPPKLESCEATQTSALLRFSEPVQQAEVEDPANLEIQSPVGTVIHSAAAPIAGLRLSYSAAIRSLQIDGLTFSYGDEVRFLVSNALDLVGNSIAPPSNACTTTAGRAVKPEVLSCVLDETGTATITYTKDVKPAGAGASPVDLSNFSLVVNGLPIATATASIAFDATSRTTTITGLTVTKGDPYQITVSNVTDIFGNEMDEDGVANVCSGNVSDALNPTVDSVGAYANGIEILYSEAMDRATTAVASRYTVTEGGVGVVLRSVSIDATGKRVTLVPQSPLTLSGALTVVIRDVTDLSGRLLNPNPTTQNIAVGFSLTIPGHGLTLFSVPMIFAPPADDPATILGANAKVARFDSTLNIYQVYPTTQFGLEVGRGYWGRFTVDTPVLLSGGQFVPTAVPFAYNLPSNNWSLFGNPFLQSLSWNVDSLRVRTGATVVPLRQLVGVANPAMEIYAWGYAPLTRDYFLISDPRIIPGAQSLIPVGSAVWVRSNTSGVVLQVPAPNRAAAPAPIGRADSEDLWSVELIARSGDAVDAGNLLGVSRGRAVVVGNPPPQPDRENYVELSFVSSGRAGESRSEVDLRGELGSRAAWDVEVRTDRVNSEVRLSWPDLSSLPKRYRLRLTDTLTGRSVAMRTARYYSFHTGRSPAESRRLRVELVPADESGLRVSNVAVVQGGRGNASGLTISYAVNREADVQVRVLSAAGRPVGAVSRQTVRAGLNHVVWSGRQAGGQALARGLYLVEITARDEEGQATRAVRMAPVR